MKEIATKEFLKILSAAKPGLAKKELIEQSTHFVFRKGKLYTFNDEIAVCYPVPVEIEGAVQAREFYSFLSNIREKEIMIGEKDGTLCIEGEKFQATFNLLKPSLPIDEIQYPEEWKPLPDKFKELFELSATCVSRDMATPVLTCVHFNHNYMESCDNFKLVRVFMPEELGFEALIAGVVPSLLSSYDTPLRIGITDAWVHFGTDDGCVFSCRRFMGSYPNLDELLNSFEKDTAIRFPKGLVEVLDKAEPLAMEDEIGNKYVDVIVTKEHMVIHTASQIGSFKEVLKVKNRKNLTFRTRIDTLRTVIKLYKKAFVNENVDRLLFQSDAMVHLVALK